MVVTKGMSDKMGSRVVVSWLVKDGDAAFGQVFKNLLKLDAAVVRE